MTIQLTAKSQAIVAKIKARLPQVRAEYGVNALSRIHYEFGRHPGALVDYALGRATGCDIDTMVQLGCAKRV